MERKSPDGAAARPGDRGPTSGPAAPSGPGTAAGASSGPASEPAPLHGGLLPSIAAPRGGGSIRGIGEKFSTNPATGTASLSIPLATSPGRSGFELSLSLSYDSGAGNGPFGIGWSLATPAITRKTDKGLPRYLDAEESDTFILSGAEDLVPVRIVDGAGTRLDAYEAGEHRVQRFRPRVEGLFARIERWTHLATRDVHWRATTKENVTSVYGRSERARIADPADAGRTFSWLLEETRDDRGNVVHYEYEPEDGAGVDPARASEASRFAALADGSRAFRATAQRYLKRVRYGNSKPDEPSGWLFEVVLDYGEHDALAPTPDPQRPWPCRRDPFSSFRAGFEVRTYRLCRRVLVFHRFEELGPEPCLVRSTDLAYDEGAAVSYLVRAEQAGYLRTAPGAYERRALPRLDLAYSRPELRDVLRRTPRRPEVGDLAAAQWVDLDGEGIPGLLVPTERAWFYARNRGDGKLDPPEPLAKLPAPAELRGGVQHLMDLSGDGQLDLVQYRPPLPGFFARTPDGDWEPFAAFRAMPNVDWSDPNLRFADLDGDGHADALITEDEALVWYRSRAKDGFAPAQRVAKGTDERRGPAVVFADGTQSVHLADMSGDGLVDLVRVRNGEVAYWPNLGHGRFGPKVTMERPPRFDGPDRFDPGRVRFGDVDGSGTSDVFYLASDGVLVFPNQSGNGFGEPTRLTALPPQHSAARVEVVDLLGQGTSCLVWTSTLPGTEQEPLAYLDPTEGRKAHLLERIVNNLGAETRVRYAPSTAFYLRDAREGRPWLTRLSFPVQVVERIEREDHVSATKVVTRFRYHHGYFDGDEREFRGFAAVEQWDAEEFQEKDRGNPLRPPPAHVKTWFHTGAWLGRERLEAALAREYYRGDPDAPLLRDTPPLDGLTLREQREAARALRGQVLRQETYADDLTPEAAHPYSVSERSHVVRLLQRADGRAHAVFHVHPGETVTIHYERRPDDPRVQHELVLDVDEFGNVTRSAAIAYPRRVPQQPEQGKLWATFTESRFANLAAARAGYRVGVPVELATNELTGLVPPARGLLAADAVRAAIAGAGEIPYEQAADGATLQRRVIERERRYYYSDAATDALPLGTVEPRALPCRTLRLALTPGLVAEVYGDRVDDAILADEGRYLKEDGLWWAPSARPIYEPALFYAAVEAIDPFGGRHRVRHDRYALLVEETRDPLDNLVTAGERNADGTPKRGGNDYRVLAPALVSDANRNRTAVAYDALGMVSAIAAMGREGDGEGDTLEDPTVRVEYALDRWKDGLPAYVRTAAREKHGAANTRWQESYTYADGAGRQVMKKVRAEPGPAAVTRPDGSVVVGQDGRPEMSPADPRWIATGRTVFDAKGNPIRKYEPYFSRTHEYESETALVQWGVAPILNYDPLGRLVGMEQPNGTRSRVEFDAWRQVTWDENDAVADTSWLRAKEAGTAPERRCAALALAHANTPAVAHVDPLGRGFLSIADNGGRGKYATCVELDVEGNARRVTDPRANDVALQRFDVLGRRVHLISADAGEASVLLDVADKPCRTWDARGFAARRRFDALQRPTHQWVRESDGPERLAERVVYGERHAEAEARKLRGRAWQVYDASGAVTTDRFDLAGRAIEAIRQLAAEWRGAPDWSALATMIDPTAIATAAAPALDPERFVTTTTHDALGRVEAATAPDGSVVRPSYNAAGLLESVAVNVRGAPESVRVVQNVRYNERGQRLRVGHANGTITQYAYDPKTFRLVRQWTTVGEAGPVRQDLRYEHDPVGNVVEIEDRVSYCNPAVPADTRYEYDAIYQIVKTEGREHPGQMPFAGDPAIRTLDAPGDSQALRRYWETYDYDPGGNVVEVTHGPVGGTKEWTRAYHYAERSNRLLTTTPGDDSSSGPSTYEHDASGNVSKMPHLAVMRWDHAGRLVFADRSGGGKVHVAYDAAGQRVRKAHEHSGVLDERIYLGSYEVHRRRTLADGALKLERQTLHVMDDRRRVVLVETLTVDAAAVPFTSSTRHRYQLENHLSSSSMELDEAGEPITYEEYCAYGTTSFHAARGAFGGSAKRYRYTGKERDDETGLYYHGARYYASWLARWTACDPAGMVDGTSLYRYARGNPVRNSDPTGTDAKDRSNTLGARNAQAAADARGYFYQFNNRDFEVGFRGGEEVARGSEARRADEYDRTRDLLNEDKGRNTKNWLNEAGELDTGAVKADAKRIAQQAAGHAAESGKPVIVSITAYTGADEKRLEHLATLRQEVEAELKALGARGVTIETQLSEKLHALAKLGRAKRSMLQNMLSSFGGKAEKALQNRKVQRALVKGAAVIKRAKKMIPVVGTVLAVWGWSTTAEAAVKGTDAAIRGDRAAAIENLGTAGLDVAETVPVAGNVVAAGRTGAAIGEVMSELFADDDMAYRHGDAAVSLAKKLGASEGVATAVGGVAAAGSALLQVATWPLRLF